jgi:AAA15 family ATPase/GTPase
LIRVHRIQIKNFRGIRNLDLPINGKSLVIYGPNGSGKSGVIDAIEFALALLSHVGEADRALLPQ